MYTPLTYNSQQCLLFALAFKHKNNTSFFRDATLIKKTGIVKSYIKNYNIDDFRFYCLHKDLNTIFLMNELFGRYTATRLHWNETGSYLEELKQPETIFNSFDKNQNSSYFNLYDLRLSLKKPVHSFGSILKNHEKSLLTEDLTEKEFFNLLAVRNNFNIRSFDFMKYSMEYLNFFCEDFSIWRDFEEIKYKYDTDILQENQHLTKVVDIKIKKNEKFLTSTIWSGEDI